MIVKSYIKVSNECINDSKMLESIITNHIKDKSGYIKGKLLVFKYIKIGLNEDDFTRNIQTILLTWNLFKAPRISSKKNVMMFRCVAKAKLIKNKFL